MVLLSHPVVDVRPLRSKASPKATDRPVQTGFDRSPRTAKDTCHLGFGEIECIAGVDHQPIFLTQCVDVLYQPGAPLPRDQPLFRTGISGGEISGTGTVAPSEEMSLVRAPGVLGLIGDDLEHPGSKRCVRPKPRKMEVRLQEGGLRGVLGVIRVA